MQTEWIGWASALVLFSTVTWQAVKQWRTENSEGVSSLLFVGQIFASIGFLAYAAMRGDTVFVVTNVLMIGSALLGLACVVRDRLRKRRRGSRNVEAEAYA